MYIVDALDWYALKPVIMAKKSIKKHMTEIKVKVDNPHPERILKKWRL